jgi:hypothetical protein
MSRTRNFAAVLALCFRRCLPVGMLRIFNVFTSSLMVFQLPLLLQAE